MRRILVVEDDPGIARVLDRGLKSAGYAVDLETDGLTAAGTWRQGTFDAVILDVMLPGMDGIELLELRRGQGDVTPVVLLTARDDDATRRNGQRAGASAFLTKPYAYSDLLSVLERIIPSARGSGTQRRARS